MPQGRLIQWSANLNPSFLSNKKISICCWAKPESYVSGAYLWGKFDTSGKRTLAIIRDFSTLKIFWGYGTGDTYETIDTGLYLYNGEWYHLAVSVDGIKKFIFVRVYRKSTGTVVYSNTFYAANELNVEDAPVTLAARADGSSAYAFDGKIDEVVVFNDLLSIKEIDNIRTGTYAFNSGFVVDQTLAQVEYDLEPIIKAHQVIAQVEIILNPTGIYVCQMLGQVEYVEGAGPGPGARRIFPVPHIKTTWQSQAGKRKFPVVIGSSWEAK
ncbi:MAG: LamG domain-containing protein [Deltaproteobacteria bacterium]|nr:MAG: LamG domain-containing protein [Deltaproteobacteria bacterium]